MTWQGCQRFLDRRDLLRASPIHQFKEREARDHWREILDRAEGGVVSVVRRTSPVVVAPRAVIGRALAALHPFAVQVTQVLMYGENRDALRSVVFGDE